MTEIMGTPLLREFLVRKFPTLPLEIVDYLTDSLYANMDDFQSMSDIFDAVGDHILCSCDEANEENVTEACQRLADMLISDSGRNFRENHRRVLVGPVTLGAGNSPGNSESEFNSSEGESIWFIRNEQQNLQVNQKKLEKAEAKIKEKQDKRSNKPTVPAVVKYEDISASASQAASKKGIGAGQSMDVRIENIDLAFGERHLLKGANLVLAYGRRCGLVGRNGIGKTTLFRMISSGQLSIPPCIRMLHVAQEVEGDETTVLDSVLESDVHRENLLKEERRIQNLLLGSLTENADSLTPELNEIYKQLEACEADKAPGLAATILCGLGFNHEQQQRPTSEFSGGWRMRLALAQGLFIKPDLLLLDEPTNMLDMKAIYWLESYLQNWPSTLFVVSHDRNFLNSVCTDIIHMHSGRLDVYKGNYDNFEKAKEEKLKQQQREYEAQQQLREHAQAFIDKFRYNAKRASLVQSKIKMLEKLPVLKPVDREHKVTFKFADTEPLNPPILQLDEVNFKYGVSQPWIFYSVCLGADMDSRICIVGENGAGKTTLLKLLMGELEPTEGCRKGHRHLKIGYFTQHHVDQLVMDTSSLQLAASRYPGLSVEAYRAALGKFGISGDLALQSVLTLSGGQKSRLAFALINLSNPNFLILDEPTNHLDVESVEALGKSLCTFKGGVVLVSHDERLIQIVCNELWVVRNSAVDRLEGGLEEYKRLVCKELGL